MTNYGGKRAVPVKHVVPQWRVQLIQQPLVSASFPAQSRHQSFSHPFVHSFSHSISHTSIHASTRSAHFCHIIPRCCG